jgi:3-oxoacyl-[acyl-carrier-protein] synthase-3
MTHAAITGWGKCLPPAILNNNDLTTFLDTDEDWIVSRTGMHERRISHVSVSELAHVACVRALAAAGKSAKDVELIVFGSCTFDEMVPNSSSKVQHLLGADNAASMDVNTACTSGMYSLTVATAMIRTGVVKNALVIGAEVITPAMDWSDRNVAILFGDGAAAFFLEADEEKTGVISESLGCYADARAILAVRNWGLSVANQGIYVGQIFWDFEGPEIFKKAVSGMGKACVNVLAKEGLEKSDIDLVVPHQANLRIIDALARRLSAPKDKIFVNIERYGNMSAATAPVALVEAIEEGHVNPGDNVLMPAFGAGLTWSAHLIRWGQRTQTLEETDIDLPACEKTGLEMVQEIIEAKARQLG